MELQLTVADVKRDLPSVKVRIGKKIVWARVMGRNFNYPYVTVSGGWSLGLGARWRDWSENGFVGRHYPWETVTRSINTGKPLNGDD